MQVSSNKTGGHITCPASFYFLVFLSFILLALSVAAVKAEPVSPELPRQSLVRPELTLEIFIQRALQNSPQVKAARHGGAAAAERWRALRAPVGPLLEVTPGFLGNAEARDEEAVLSQPLDLFGKRRAHAAVGAAAVRRADAELITAQQQVVTGVKNAATALFAAQEAEALAQVQVEVAENLRVAAARRAELGEVPAVQVQRAELEKMRAQQELTAAEGERLTQQAQANQWLDQAPQTPLRIASPFEASELAALTASIPTAAAEMATALPVPDRAALLRAALSSRGDLLSQEAVLSGQRAQAAALRYERMPSLALQVRRSSVWQGEGSYALRAVISLPLFDRGVLKHERRAAEQDVRVQEALTQQLRANVATQIEQALVGWKQHRQTVERYRTSIVPLTSELLRKMQVGYAQGASSYLEVLEAQLTLRQVQYEYLTALVGARRSEAALETALGVTNLQQTFPDRP